MKKEFFIRDASNEDVPEVKDLIFRVLQEYGLQPEPEGKDRNLNDLEENYFNQNGYFGVVINGDRKKIIGTFGITYKDRNTCELRKMFLSSDQRGKGIGKAILKRAIEIARQKKYKTIFLETASPLKEAIGLYKSFGFKETKVTETTKRCDQAYELEII